MFNIYYLLLVFIVPYLFVYNLSGSRSSHCLKIFLCNKVPIHLILVFVELRGQTLNVRVFRAVTGLILDSSRRRLPEWTGNRKMSLKISSDKIPERRVNIHDGWLGPRILECPMTFLKISN